MDMPSEESGSLLRQHSSTLSDCSIGSNSTVVASPTSPISILNRPRYYRIPPVAEEEASHEGADAPGIENPETSNRQIGLGITDIKDTPRVSIARVPVGSKSSPTNPGSPDPLISPTSAKLGGKSYRSMEDQLRSLQEGDPYRASTPSINQSFTANSEHERLRTRDASSAMVSTEPLAYEKNFSCKTRRHFQTGLGNWFAISIVFLSVYSTVFSGIWLFVAITKPRYGHTITTAGSLTPPTATVLCTASAKSIELSFVTVFVAFLGQVLSTRALTRRKGITIAEMSMRSWVLQPGTMISRWESVRFAASSVLGVVAILAALMAMIYTTASDALVAPKLMFGKVEDRLMYGKVYTSFANPDYVMKQCKTPIQKSTDPENYAQTCIQIQHSGQAYHNYMQYLSDWVDSITRGNGSDTMDKRPGPVGMLYDNTTVNGSWIDIKTNEISKLSNNYTRIVDNVTMAMPHSGVVAAARDPLNNIVQPQEFSVSLVWSLQI